MEQCSTCVHTDSDCKIVKLSYSTKGKSAVCVKKAMKMCIKDIQSYTGGKHNV